MPSQLLRIDTNLYASVDDGGGRFFHPTLIFFSRVTICIVQFENCESSIISRIYYLSTKSRKKKKKMAFHRITMEGFSLVHGSGIEGQLFLRVYLRLPSPINEYQVFFFSGHRLFSVVVNYFYAPCQSISSISERKSTKVFGTNKRE